MSAIPLLAMPVPFCTQYCNSLADSWNPIVYSLHYLSIQLLDLLQQSYNRDCYCYFNNGTI